MHVAPGQEPICFGIDVESTDTELSAALRKAIGKFQETSEGKCRPSGLMIGGSTMIGPAPAASIFVGAKPLPK
jgi:hypothetical protein